MTVFGHAAIQSRLSAELPVVSLLRGPDSVGKWTLASALVAHQNLQPADVRTYPYLSMDSAREIVDFTQRAPFGPFKAVQASLDGASPAVLATLLKLLEEPPPIVKFVLVASLPVLDTVVSRCHIENLGLLTTEQVFQVMTQALNIPPQQARRAAELSRGQVEPALRAGEMGPAKAKVMQVLLALAQHDPALLDRVADATGEHTWGDAEHLLLGVWATEAITGRWRVFTVEDSRGLHARAVPRQLLGALGNEKIADARPALALRVALAPLVSA